MKLLKLTMNNFMPYRGEHRISFPSDAQHNVMLLFGDNMRGKTSFLNAIRWCFYGKALGRHLKEIGTLDIVNWDAAKDNDWHVSVNITFDNEGDEYDLRRNIQPKELIYKPRSNSDFAMEVMLRKNGNVINGGQIKHELNQIMPEDISRFFLFDGELLQEYEMLLNDKDEQGRVIKESIEKVLGVPALINARIELETLLREARKRQAKDSQHIESVKRYTDEIQKLEAEREALEDDLKDLEQQHASYQTQIEVIDQELDQKQSLLVGKQKLDERKSEQKRLSDIIEGLRDRKLTLLKDAWKDLIQPMLHTRISHLEEQRKDSESTQKNKITVENRIENLEKIISSKVCPTCEQNIADSKKDAIKTELTRLQREIEKYADDYERVGSISERLNKLYRIQPSGATSSVPAIDREIRQSNLRITELDSEIEELERQLRGHDTSEMIKQRAARDGLLKLLGRIEDNLKDRRSKILENENKSQLLAKQLESNAATRAQKSTKLVHTYSALKDIFTESIDALRDSLRENVANLSTEAFKRLTTEKTYQGLDINQNYGLTILDRDNRQVSQRSAGAEQIVALALIDGLNRTARKTGPIVMDTPLGRLDLKHRDNVLRYIPDMGEQVILLVHEGEIRKDDILQSLKSRIGKVYNIERVSSSESKLVEV